MAAAAINNARDRGLTAFFPVTFPDENSTINPDHSSSFGDYNRFQESFFDLEKSSPVHYTASMPDFKVFSMSESSDDDKRFRQSNTSPSFDHPTVDIRRSTKSPLSFSHTGYSSEAPARLYSPQRFLKPFRQRAVSLSILEGSSESFVTLESTSTPLFDLPSLVSRADTGLKYGVDPILAEGAMGGTYFLRDRGRLITVVCKPGRWCDSED
jgi:hypothetical protein